MKIYTRAKRLFLLLGAIVFLGVPLEGMAKFEHFQATPDMYKVNGETWYVRIDYEDVRKKPTDYVDYFGSLETVKSVIIGKHMYYNSNEHSGPQGFHKDKDNIPYGGYITCNQCHGDGGMMAAPMGLIWAAQKYSPPRYWKSRNIYRDLQKRGNGCGLNCAGGHAQSEHPSEPPIAPREGLTAAPLEAIYENMADRLTNYNGDMTEEPMPNLYGEMEAFFATINDPIDREYYREMAAYLISKHLHTYIWSLSLGIVNEEMKQDYTKIPGSVTPLPEGSEFWTYSFKKGKELYKDNCRNCHGDNGEGEWNDDLKRYDVPPLSGFFSYTKRGGIYRNSTFSSMFQPLMPGDKPGSLSHRKMGHISRFLQEKTRSNPLANQDDWKHDPCARNPETPLDMGTIPVGFPFSGKRIKNGPRWQVEEWLKEGACRDLNPFPEPRPEPPQ